MAGLGKRIEAATRQARAIGPVRLVIGLAGLALAYSVIGLSLSGSRSSGLALLGDLALLVPMIAWYVTVTTIKGHPSGAAWYPAAAGTHFMLVVLVLFLLWEMDFLPIHRPSSAKDFSLLFPALLGLAFSTAVLAAPGRALALDDAMEPLPET